MRTYFVLNNTHWLGRALLSQSTFKFKKKSKVSNKDTVTFPASVNTSDYSFFHTAHLTIAGAAAARAADVHQEREFIWRRFQSATHHFFLSFFLFLHRVLGCPFEWASVQHQQQRLFFYLCYSSAASNRQTVAAHTLAMQRPCAHCVITVSFFKNVFASSSI